MYANFCTNILFSLIDDTHPLPPLQGCSEQSVNIDSLEQTMNYFCTLGGNWTFQ